MWLNTSTAFTCDQDSHHVVMDVFVNAINLKNKDVRKSDDEQDFTVLSILCF